MCGITGFFSPQGFRESEASANALRMRDSLIHRGPDDAGLWLDAQAGIALSHRRLAIVDLSSAGHQPMASASGRYQLVFNGEIYNHREVRRSLEGIGQRTWRGHSDTETLLAAIEAWGLEKALQKSVGMFALALWDGHRRQLSLARDRMGEKPLYYGWQGPTLLFGSELKALRAHPVFRSEINRDVLPLYLRHACIPAPWSIWKGIQKLTPGCLVTFLGDEIGKMPTPSPYWSLEEAIAAGQADPFRGSDEEAINALEQRLRDAVAGQMLADVPLGAFLSGGVDSSTVVALMQVQSSRPVKTFTIGFDVAGYNEANHANAVATHLGTEHTELYVTATQAREVIPQLPVLYDEPFGDSSAIPTHLVSQLARQHVTVSLSGDGGDELFGGYSRYFNHKAQQTWQATRKIPAPLRSVTASMLRSPLPGWADRFVHATTAQLRRPAHTSFRLRTERIADLSECASLAAYYRTMTSQWSQPPVLRDGARLSSGAPNALLNMIAEPVQQMMATDSLAYLPDDILVKVDRAAMAVSLESRVPLLDHRIIELAWRIPYSMKVRHGQGKWLLRQVLYRHVPCELIERPKMGFGVPVGDWIRSPLRDWAEDLLDERGMKEQALLNPQPIRERWKQHLSGQHNWRDSLWLVLMFQAWKKQHSTTFVAEEP